MATERSEHQQWADSQIAALIELGVNPMDAQKATDWVLANLPTGADPAIYIFPDNALWQEPDAPGQLSDSRAAWMSDENIPPRFKRLLEARQETE